MGAVTTTVTAARQRTSEWRWPAIFAALVMALTTVPYVAAAARQTEQWRFGGFLFGVEDGNAYIADMGQGARGAWLFTLPYSSEPQSGALIYTFYLALGKLAGPGHDASMLVFHAARLICGWAMLMVSYWFVAEFLPRVKQRRLALALVAGGGGLGWLLMLGGQGNLLGSLPVDFISPEAFSFLDLYGLPHLAAARCLFLLALLAHLRGRPVWAGLALLALSLIQPLYVLSAWVIMAADVGLRALLSIAILRRPEHVEARRAGLNAFSLLDLKGLAATGLISSPLVIYTTVVLSLDPVLKYWLVQNRLPSPHPLHYVFAYGVYLLLGVWGWRALNHIPAPVENQRLLVKPFSAVADALRRQAGVGRSASMAGDDAERRTPAPTEERWSQEDSGALPAASAESRRLGELEARETGLKPFLPSRPRLALFLLAWVVVVPFLLYAPISTQRRLVEGFQLPMVILAVWGLTVGLRRWRYWLLPAVLSLTLPTTVLLMVSGLAGTLQPGEPVYHPAAELKMFDWLNTHAAPGQVALSAYDTGNVLPAYTPLTAYIGHGPETVNLEAKLPRVKAFYQAATADAERRQLLAEGRVTWVIFGPAERTLGDFEPAASSELRREYSEGDYSVYRVIP